MKERMYSVSFSDITASSEIMVDNVEKKLKRFRLLTFSVISVNLGTLTVGSTIAWSSPALPKLSGTYQNPLGQPVTSVEASLITSLLPLAVTVAAVTTGIIADHIGRKRTLVLSSINVTLSYCIIAFSTEVWHLLLARLLAGYALGTFLLIQPTYVSEIAEKTNRGFYGCLMHLSLCIGKLLMFCVGPYCSFFVSSGIVLVPIALFYLSFAAWAPETPYYLVMKGDLTQASIALSALGRRDPKLELLEIKQLGGKKLNHLELWRDDGSRKMFLKITVILLVQQLSGFNAFMFYLEPIFHASGSNLSPEVSVIVVGVVQLLSTIAAPLLVERMGRRFLLLFSCLTGLVSLVALSGYFFMSDSFKENLLWIPMASLMLFIVAYNFGLGPVSFVLLGETFPPHAKAVAGSTALSLSTAATFISALAFPHMLSTFGQGASFSCFACVCAVGFVFVFFMIPETKGKSLIEIYKEWKCI